MLAEITFRGEPRRSMTASRGNAGLIKKLSMYLDLAKDWKTIS